VRAGGIGVEDLQDEQMDRRDRIEDPFPPVMLELRTDLSNRGGRKYVRQVVADLTQGRGDAKGHPDRVFLTKVFCLSRFAA
jgi:hypothetical protein